MRHIGKHVSAVICAAALLLVGCEKKPQSSTPAVTGSVTITAFDVGKADAFLLQTASKTIVLDTGNKGDGKAIEKLLEGQEITKIDLLIISHFDKDHVGGAARLLKKMEIGEVYLPDYAGTCDEYYDFCEKLEEKSISPIKVPMKTSQSWQYDDVLFQLDSAQKNDYGKNEENDFSLCLFMQHGDNTFLFTGDAEEARQEEILSMKYGKVDFLKFPYHGNYLSTTEKFLDACAPEYAVVCCSSKEPAAKQTMETMKKRGIQTFYTQNGDVTIASDGKTIQISQ